MPNYLDCHPPIIINITDGEPTDAGSSFHYLKNEANQIKQICTNYGSVNILNIHISAKTGDRVLFPSDIVHATDKFTQLLFDISTPLTENMINLARKEGYNVQDNAKGYVFNGSATDLIKFLNIGTPK